MLYIILEAAWIVSRMFTTRDCPLPVLA